MTWLGAEAEAAKLLLREMQQVGFDDEAQQLTLESETSFVEAIEKALEQADETDALSVALDARITALQERRERLKFRAERIRDSIMAALDASGVKLPLRLPSATVSLTTRAGGVHIVDARLLREEAPQFWREEVQHVLDKAAVGKALKEGQPVPGAMLGNSRRALLIRR